MDYQAMFMAMHPHFFENPGIRNLPETAVATELVMDLHDPEALKEPVPCPAHITFGIYEGKLAPLHEAIGQVEQAWVQYFKGKEKVFCAFDGDKIVAFCGVGDMGCVDGKRIAGPGCVGTIPAYRKSGIGLEMVRRATMYLRDDGVDIGWIHYTCLTSWYSKIGYKPVFSWNCRGILPQEA